MGNRAYFTLKTKSESRTFYMHWNGGLDTFAPLSRAIFDSNTKDLSKIVRFIETDLELKLELQESSEATSWLEENGHYFLDLESKTLEQVLASGMRVTHNDLSKVFDEYVQNRIREEYRTKMRDTYWNPILESAARYFGSTQ